MESNARGGLVHKQVSDTISVINYWTYMNILKSRPHQVQKWAIRDMFLYNHMARPGLLKSREL